MEENTKTEQFLDLDEKQLQAIAGGWFPFNRGAGSTYGAEVSDAIKNYKSKAAIADMRDLTKKFTGDSARVEEAHNYAATSLEKINKLNEQEQARLAAKRLGK